MLNVPNPFDKKEIKRAFDLNTAEEDLKKFLLRLPYSRLIQIMTIMYYGRDGDDIISLYKHFQQMKEPKDLTVQTILEKLNSLTQYFNDAIVNAKNKGIDLNVVLNNK